MASQKYLLALLTVYAVIIFLFTNTAITSHNELTRLLTAQSLLRDHNFTLFEDAASIQNIGGDFIYDGTSWYSDKPPLMAALTAGVAKIFLHDDFSFAEEFTARPVATYYILSLLFSGIPALFLLYFFYRSLELTAVPARWRIVHTGVLGFCTMVLPFATVYAGHVLLALALFLSFYCWLRYQHLSAPRGFEVVCAGFCMGFALAFDVATSAFFVFGMLMMWLSSLNVRMLFWLLLGMLPWGIVFVALNLLTTGFPLLPWYAMYRAYLVLPENYFKTATLVVLTPLQTLVSYISALATDRRSVLITSPVTAYALWHLAKRMRLRMRYWREALVVGISSFLFFIILFSVTIDFGGSTRTLRWMLPFVPLWFWFFAISYRPRRWAERITLCMAAAISAGLNIWFANDPWMSFHNFSLWRFLVN